MGAFVETNGIRLHYREHGVGDLTMVFMPGLTANCESIELLPDGRLVEVPGNHVTLLFGEFAQPVVSAISAFVREDGAAGCRDGDDR